MNNHPLISFYGLQWSLTAGFTLGGGTLLLADCNTDLDKTIQSVFPKCVGGALLVTGIYLASPSAFRAFWVLEQPMLLPKR